MRVMVLKAALVALFATTVCAGSGIGGGSSENGTFLLDVFDCYMPISNQFVVHTGEKGRTTLSLRSDTEVVRIVVSDYKASLDPSFVKAAARKEDGLTVEEFTVTSAFREDLPVVRLHDGKQQILVYGQRDGLLESMLRGCQELKHGALYE